MMVWIGRYEFGKISKVQDCTGTHLEPFWEVTGLTGVKVCLFLLFPLSVAIELDGANCYAMACMTCLHTF